jgi:hypothetical protein
MRRNIKQNVYRRIAANRQRAVETQQRDQKEREVVQPEKDDIVGQCAAGVIRVKRIG